VTALPGTEYRAPRGSQHSSGSYGAAEVPTLRTVRLGARPTPRGQGIPSRGRLPHWSVV